jgi:hypothetical protein
MRSQIEKRCVLQDMLVARGRGGSIIRPLPGNSKGPPGRARQDEGLDGTDLAGLENLKPPASERVKGMGDFCPSQILTVTMCCYLEPSRRCWIDLSSRR